MLKRLSLVLFLLISGTHVLARQKIVSGETLKHDNPGFYNAVALVKEDGRIFCTGSLIAPQIIATAKHCLVDKDPANPKIKVYFGDDTNLIDESLYRKVLSWDIRHPTDWEMSFPSFDVAWVKFEGPAPSAFHTLPILSDPSRLRPGMEVIQVGFGDHHPEPNIIRAGKKLWGKTRLKRYINNPRFFHILLFEGDQGQGSCHGDSGGPAYVKLDEGWHIIGVTNGFDLVLTPQAMMQTGDEDFPYSVDCAQNQSLYSFLGAHGFWIESTSGIVMDKSDEFLDLDRELPLEDYQSLKQWCEGTDIGSPQWNLLKVLMDQRVDEIGQEEAGDFYEDCDQVVTYLNGLESVYLDYNEVAPSNLAFDPLKHLPNLKELSLLNYPKAFLALDTLKGLNLKTLTLKNLGLETLDFLQENFIEELSLEQNPLYDIAGILKTKNLRSLNLSGTSVKDLRILNPLELKELRITGLNSSVVFGLDTIAPHLELFDARNTVLATPMVVGRMTNLKTLLITGDNSPLDLRNLTKLKDIQLKDFFNSGVIFPDDLSSLVSLSANQCDISDLSFLESAKSLEELNLTFNRIGDLSPLGASSFSSLKELNLSGNPILDVAPLANLESLELLRLFRTPLQRGQIPKTEDNCPQKRGPSVLNTFCAN